MQDAKCHFFIITILSYLRLLDFEAEAARCGGLVTL